jgi:AcrR family transcriptional regulator
MSGKRGERSPGPHGPHPRKELDVRVRRSRDALGGALIALMQEKPFDAITVQDVLDRAGVSRSTFYQHYSDKDDLFTSDADEFFEWVSTALSLQGDRSERVAPVREFFTHVAEMRGYIAALLESGRAHQTYELARGHFARGIERRLGELPRARGIAPEQRRVMAVAYAGGLVSLLDWWIGRGMDQSPAALDELFHRMVWSGVASSPG